MIVVLHELRECGLNGLERALEGWTLLDGLSHELEHGFAEPYFDLSHRGFLRWDHV
jgi:hypothetical protein